MKLNVTSGVNLRASPSLSRVFASRFTHLFQRLQVPLTQVKQGEPTHWFSYTVLGIKCGFVRGNVLPYSEKDREPDTVANFS